MKFKNISILIICLTLLSTITPAYGFNPGHPTLHKAQHHNDFSNFVSSYPYVVAYISNKPNFTVENILASVALDRVAPSISFIHANSSLVGLRELPHDLQLVSLPAFVLFKNGVPLSIRYGYLTPKDLLRFIEMHFGTFITTAIQKAPHLFLSFGKNFSPTWWRHHWRPSWWQQPSRSLSRWKPSRHPKARQIHRRHTGHRHARKSVGPRPNRNVNRNRARHKRGVRKFNVSRSRRFRGR